MTLKATELKNQIRDVVLNTHDMCGPVLTRAIEHCQDENLDCTVEQVERAVFAILEEEGLV